jgi:hypothetical protein
MRRVKAVALSRRNNEQFTRGLQAKSPEDWPKLLKHAWAIAAVLGDAQAREVVISTIAAAHDCACAVSTRALFNERNRVRDELLSALEKLIKPIERRKPIQRALDEIAQREFRDGNIDLEVMSRFFHGCADVVRLNQSADATRIFKAVGGPTEEIEELSAGQTPLTLKIINHYEAMHPVDRETVEAALRELIGGQSGRPTTLRVFAAMIDSLRLADSTELDERAGDLLTQYVAAAAEIWRGSGLDPTRSRHPDDPEYRSSFHHFVELILIDQFDPRTRLFDRADDQELKLAREVYARLPEDLRADTRVGPRYEWLISEHYLRRVLRPPEKNGVKTP